MKPSSTTSYFPCSCPPHSVFVIMTNTSAATNAAAAATLPATTAGPYVRPSRCTVTQGTTHCTCEPGYTISGRDSGTCTGKHNSCYWNTCWYLMSQWQKLTVCALITSDIDECELFHNGQGGRLCLHACVNTPGGYRCSCPAGYNSTKDGRSCKGEYGIFLFFSFAYNHLTLLDGKFRV